ncbi:MAG TPA: Nif3-like dinuclear metal center hexameric protein [Candidatus Paceibacterota bacterium]|nr:Nif3-like dinuclear metal center hexameric protein [Candidatus Paceibacterota bacterium]
MKIKDLTQKFDYTISPKKYQESYDNCGLIVGNSENEITGVLTTLDIDEFVIQEAIEKKCNLIISHHPTIFKGLKTLTGNSFNEKLVISAIKNDIAIYAAHTSLDNRFHGSINEYLAKQIGLTNIEPLKLPNDINNLNGGSGAIGTIEGLDFVVDFLGKIKYKLKLVCAIKHSSIIVNRPIKKVAICTGAGFFMANEAKRHGADLFITSDLTYHNFFDERDILLADIGHYESEKHSSVVIHNLIKDFFPEMNVIISSVNTNPVSYVM